MKFAPPTHNHSARCLLPLSAAMYRAVTMRSSGGLPSRRPVNSARHVQCRPHSSQTNLSVRHGSSYERSRSHHQGESDQTRTNIIRSKSELLVPMPASAFGLTALLAAGLLYCWLGDDAEAAEAEKTEPKEKLVRNGEPANEGDLTKPQLVILGTGWGAVSLLKNLDTDAYNVTVVSPRNYFLFTPMLPGAATGTVDHRSIIEPVRRILAGKRFTSHFYEAHCTDIDPEAQMITCLDSGSHNTFRLRYDKLVVAVGAKNNTYGTPGVEEYCQVLKEIPDSIKLRSKVLNCLENASLPGLPEEERKRLLSFVVVGGGPTGVELAAELHDFLRTDLVRWYPHLIPHVSLRIVQSADHILNAYDAGISDYTERKFARDGIDVMTNLRVLSVEPGEVRARHKVLGKEVVLPYSLCVWSTGIGPKPLIISLANKLEGQRNTRALTTDEYLEVKQAPNIYAIGDCSTIDQRKMLDHVTALFAEADANGDGSVSVEELNQFAKDISKKYPQLQEYGKRMDALFKQFDVDKNNGLSVTEFSAMLTVADSMLKNLPTTAQVASQQGEYLAKCFNQDGKKAPAEELPPFKYKHMGSFSYVGGYEAVGNVGNQIDMTGVGTWWLWRSIYLSKQVSIRNQCLIAFDWSKALLFGRDTSHLFTNSAQGVLFGSKTPRK